MAKLVAVDAGLGAGFVPALEAAWAAGDAVAPIDPRLPPAERAAVVSALRVGDEVEPGDAVVVATSGTTGAAKGVVLTHDAVAASARATSARLGVTGGDRWLACLPLSHVGGLGVVLRARATGTPVTVLPAFDADVVDDLARAGGATLVSLVATALRRVDPGLFRLILLGGSAPPAELPENVVTTYGLTETGGGIAYDGRPLDGAEVRIDDAGHIEVRGPMLLRQYRDGTDPKDGDGWLATGDVGQWTADGCLTVVGRADDLIITGGENVWPEVVEAVLRRHPAVSDVVVVGLPDEEWGQRVSAFVVPEARAGAPTLDELRAWVKDRLPAFAAPRSLELVDQIPQTATGKRLRVHLRERDR
ncbi:MAG: o-succinylbenzoate---CoA ligase [Actinomycetota bacterium]|nr:o-succinylbenzoate---CoA ligase [Actinomycetota bacterium]